MEQLLHDHVQGVVSHFKGKVYGWDVVNEAFLDDGKPRATIWSNSIGAAYIEMAFQWAKAADPSARLFYNDYNAEEMNAKSEAIYKMVSDFKQSGVPIDGVGFQMHVDNEQPDISSIEKNLKRFTDLGLKVRISEMSVSREGRTPEQQAALFAQVLGVCLKNKLCESFTTWGVSDRFAWKAETTPLLWDVRNKPKPAYQAVWETLKR
jgi:endo-1,4-beta-xylanase